ncbi:GtrA family protein [Flavobacterium gawalongense]|uniref:GtrA family protein n=1 Tax=Flavobacterium gawalongense TaxID=2594432 RepID=A0A553BYK5_9FLAO|nr:GtrA family protein [Flavobacterium gawalongense]TRX13402.1 GtrA family protein [Flavobacterium gawalongense]TRX15668.1 GtrA family protein [Flavobacterium gawalongense]TRX31506.1 GtrA family protein [Flavobacterium gawalongense]
MSKTQKELKRFLVAGLSAVSTDFGIYYILLNFFSTGVSKAISFLLGTIVAYVINKYWTFEKHEKSYKEIIRFGILYSLTLGVNVITNKIVLENVNIIFLAFFVATGVSTVLNFIGQKFWVFK